MRAPSVSKKSFRHAVRIFKLSKKFKNTCRLNAKGAFCPLHTSPAALSQTSSARFFDSLQGGYIIRPYIPCRRSAGVGTADVAYAENVVHAGLVKLGQADQHLGGNVIF